MGVPSEAYKWQTGKKKILWDGKESFASLAQRVKRPIDKHMKYLTGDAKKLQYFIMDDQYILYNLLV